MVSVSICCCCCYFLFLLFVPFLFGLLIPNQWSPMRPLVLLYFVSGIQFICVYDMTNPSTNYLFLFTLQCCTRIYFLYSMTLWGLWLCCILYLVFSLYLKTLYSLPPLLHQLSTFCILWSYAVSGLFVSCIWYSVYFWREYTDCFHWPQILFCLYMFNSGQWSPYEVFGLVVSSILYSVSVYFCLGYYRCIHFFQIQCICFCMNLVYLVIFSMLLYPLPVILYVSVWDITKASNNYLSWGP